MFKRRCIAAIGLLLAVCCIGLAAPEQEARTWTDQSGRFNVKATLVGVKVVLQKEDGRTIEVPFDRLKKEDQEYVKDAITGVDIIIGKVVGITDGDTVIVLDEAKAQHKIRLTGIDAPESGQAYGTQSRKALSGKIFQKTVRVEWREKDRYKRILGEIYLDDRWINKEMLEEGCAWHYKQYSDSKDLAEAETKAKGADVGLWADKDAMPPWDFRHRPVAEKVAPKPSTLPAVTAPARAPPRDDPTVYVTRTGSKYHRVGCRYLKSSSIPMPLSNASSRFSPCSVCKPPRP